MIAEAATGGLIMHNTDSFLREISYPEFVTFLITYQNVNGERFFSIFKLYNQLPPANESIIDFVKNGKGIINITEAKKLCKHKLPRTTIFKKNN